MTPPHVAEAFARQAAACSDLGSGFMAQLCGLFAARDWPAGVIRDRIFGWVGDLGPSADSVPLRLCGALHALRLRGDAGLAAVYPPVAAPDDLLWAAASDTLIREAVFIDRWIDSAPQTNEVRRSAALIACGHVLAARFGLPLRLSELGTSGGLNLNWDRFALAIGDRVFGPDAPALTVSPAWTGPLPPPDRPKVSARRGVDLNPLDPHDPQDALRLQAYLWADQPERLARTRAAIGVHAAQVDRADAIDWLEGRLAPMPDGMSGHVHLIYHTVAWQYFPKAARDRGAALIAAAGARALPDAPLAWFGMEADGGRGAALTLRLWPGDLRLHLGRADFHGRWIDWTGP